MENLKRHILQGSDLEKTVEALQACLVDLIDLSLQGKQAHWNVVGSNFRSIHLQLDEIIESARTASDEVAERIVTLSKPADGRAAVIAEKSRLTDFPMGLNSVGDTVTLIADKLQKTIEGLREAIVKVEDTDLVSQDMLIGISSALEKHLWMVQAQEK